MPTTTIITVGDLRIEVIYKPIKRLYLRVHAPDGRVSVTAPRHVSISAVSQFVLSKAAWIQQKCAEVMAAPATVEPQQCCGSTVAWVWGTAYPIQHTTGPRYAIELTPTHLVLTTPASSTPDHQAAALNQWYRQQVHQALPPMVMRWSTSMGVQVNKLFVQQMKTRWGSCAYHTGHIRLNSELAKYRPHLLEYVVVHELVHLLEPSHNQRFYALMTQFWPSWRADREELRRGLG
jgi:predicted metal-dependent hydrolase